MSAGFQPDVDLSTCDREPIHIPGSIQPHGFLLTLAGPELVVEHVSGNLAQLAGQSPRDVVGRPLAEVRAIGSPELCRAVLASGGAREPVSVATVRTERTPYRAIVHRSGDLTILELEPARDDRELSFPDLQQMVWRFVAQLQQTGPLNELMHFAASEIRRITGFDRVLVYQFDSEWNGTVVAEDRNTNLPSYMDLRFPASDIPAQARELYRMNRIRLIVDANYTPVPVEPAGPRPLDMSYSVLRSVSPVHLEYMRNMGTLASMSISLIRDGQLWGLISCHHATPRHISFELRTACDLIGQVFSLQITSRSHTERFEARIGRKELHARLLAAMAREEGFPGGLTQHTQDLLSLTGAAGAAVLYEHEVTLVGDTPSEEQVQSLAGWLASSARQDIFSTECLPDIWPGWKPLESEFAGVLAISISKLHGSFVIWFRPELVRTVNWGGDPRKPVTPEDGGMRIHPRKSFELWKETVRGQSERWSEADLEAAADLRNSIVAIVLRRAEELAELTGELERSNQELEAFSYSVSHDLRAPFRHIVGYAELLRELEAPHLSETGTRYISTIIESAHFAGTLVDNLLTFSQIARTSLVRVPVDMNVLLRETQRRLQPDIGDRNIEWKVQRLPPVEGDPALLRLAVYNLLSNAVKYTRSNAGARIEVGAKTADHETVFFVRDNGVGFDMAYVDKLFGVFQRLHRMEDFEGTGIGLANVRRIIARHGGRTWAEGVPGEGATFYFSLPSRTEVERL